MDDGEWPGEAADEPRPRTTSWVIVVVAVVAMLGLAAGVIAVRGDIGSGHAEAGRPAVRLPSPATVTRDGHTYAVGEVAPDGAVLDPTDPRTVRIIVDNRYTADANPRCNEFGGSVRLVHQGPLRVVIASFAYRPPPKKTDPPTIGCSWISGGALNRPLPIHLVRPLAGRTLIDVKTGAAIGVLDPADLPTPGYVPAGYRPTMAERFGPHNDDALAIRQYTRGGSTLEIRVRSATAWGHEGEVVGHADVQGTLATITDESYERCVTWAHPAGLVREVCSMVQHQANLSADELLKIARSLR